MSNPGTYGITPAGFVAKPLAACLSDLQASWLGNVDPTADLSPMTPEGQILAIVANDDAELWEVAQAAWNAYNREDVEGAGLDNLGDLEAVPRAGPTYTQVYATLDLDAGQAPYGAGTLVASVAGSPTLTFANVEPVTASMIVSGVAAGVLFQCTTIGPTQSVNPGALSQIVVPVTGWTSISNPDAQSQLGASEETDNAYLVRQVEEIGVDGSCNPSALVAALVQLGENQVPPVAITANVQTNPSDEPLVVDGLTLPPHTFAPIVYVPPTASVAPADIAQVIWQNTPAGLTSVGTQAVTYADPFLGDQTVFYVAPTAMPLYVVAEIALLPNYTFDSGGGVGVKYAIQSALVAAAVAPTPPGGVPPLGAMSPGGYVIGSQLSAVIAGVPGVLDVKQLFFAFTPAPTNTGALSTSPTQLATVLSANIQLSQGTVP